MLLDQPGVTEYDADASVEELLTQFDPYIIALVKHMARRRSNVINSAVADLEIDEIIQQTRIKFWRVLNQRRIENPKAYIRSIVFNLFNDMLRQRKSSLPLPVDEEGELYAGTVIIAPQDGMVDPANEYEQEEAVATLLARTADAVSSLPPRQQRAMISSLAERVDDVLQLAGAFKKHQVAFVIDWPEDASDKIRLKASLSVARKKLGHYMSIKQSEHDGADEAPVVQRSEAALAAESEPPAWDQQNGELQKQNVESEVGMEAYIDNLHEPYRTAMRLHFIEKYTYQQIADELHLPLGTAKSHVSRGLKMLRKLREMGPHLQEMSEKGTDMAEIVARAGTLREPYRTPIELHYKQKHTYPQIAGELNLPEGTVKSYISRGVKMLRKSA